MIRHKKHWTEEEIEILLDLLGEKPFNYIAKQLGRTPLAIKCKLGDLGIGISVGKIQGLLNLSELGRLLGKSQTGIKYWITERGLPCRKTLLGKKKKIRQYLINIESFWKWAKENQEVLDFRKIPYTTLLNAPNWVWELREKQLGSVPINHGNPWSKAEEEYLLFAIKGNKATVKELAKHFSRTPLDIKKKIGKLARKRNFIHRIERGSIFYGEMSILNRIERVAVTHKTDPKKLLMKWYWEDGLSTLEISHKVGYTGKSTSNICEWFKHYGIPLKQFRPFIINGVCYEPIGKKTVRGVVYYRVPTHPNTDCYGYVIEARLVMEEHLGRYLHPKEKVFHLNGDNLDSTLQNLKLFTPSTLCEKTA